eukprot:9184826-Ditylum_brightwellii.AAC.1
MSFDEGYLNTHSLMFNANIRGASICEAVKQQNVKNPYNSKPWKELDYQRKSPHLAVIPSPIVKSILLNHDPQVIQYNICDLPQITKEDEEDNEGHSDTEHDEDDSDIEDQEDISQDQEQMTPYLQPIGMNINLPLLVINTMEQFDISQV